MIRYHLMAMTLKFFSINSMTKKMYRLLGNKIGPILRSKHGLPSFYIDRTKWFLDVLEKHPCAGSGSKIIELGTGWVHWDSTSLRLFHDASFTMFDVWDNRQLLSFKSYFSDFRKELKGSFALDGEKRERAVRLLDAILDSDSFEEIYRILGTEYVIEPTGKLDAFKDDAFDCCLSFNVLEHVDESILDRYIKDLYRILKPGGYSVHSIDMSDHLTIYDREANRKNYLRYSDFVWKNFFKNDVQYFNRVQRSRWIEMFDSAGFELLEEATSNAAVPFKVSGQYNSLDPKDITCDNLRIIHRKPVKSD